MGQTTVKKHKKQKKPTKINHRINIKMTEK